MNTNIGGVTQGTVNSFGEKSSDDSTALTSERAAQAAHPPHWMQVTDERFKANLAAFDARTEQRRRVMQMLDDCFNLSGASDGTGLGGPKAEGASTSARARTRGTVLPHPCSTPDATGTA